MSHQKPHFDHRAIAFTRAFSQAFASSFAYAYARYLGQGAAGHGTHATYNDNFDEVTVEPGNHAATSRHLRIESLGAATLAHENGELILHNGAWRVHTLAPILDPYFFTTQYHSTTHGSFNPEGFITYPSVPITPGDHIATYPNQDQPLPVHYTLIIVEPGGSLHLKHVSVTAGA